MIWKGSCFEGLEDGFAALFYLQDPLKAADIWCRCMCKGVEEFDGKIKERLSGLLADAKDTAKTAYMMALVRFLSMEFSRKDKRKALRIFAEHIKSGFFRKEHVICGILTLSEHSVLEGSFHLEALMKVIPCRWWNDEKLERRLGLSEHPLLLLAKNLSFYDYGFMWNRAFEILREVLTSERFLSALSSSRLLGNARVLGFVMEAVESMDDLDALKDIVEAILKNPHIRGEFEVIEWALSVFEKANISSSDIAQILDPLKDEPSVAYHLEVIKSLQKELEK